MARSKSPLQINLEYGAVKTLLTVLDRLPFPRAVRLAETILTLVIRCIPKRRRLMRSNLQASFPEKSPAECDAIARGSLRSLARGLVVMTKLPSEDLSRFDVEFDNASELEQNLKRGKGLMLFTAHYGCWELLAAYLMNRYPGKLASVYRPLDNPKLDAMLVRKRTGKNGAAIPRKHVLRQGLRWLQNGGMMGVLMDQNYAPGGVFAPFFGRLAATVPICSILARRTGAAVQGIVSRWEGERLRVLITPTLALSKNPDLQLAIAEDTARMNATLEQWIREVPDQWLWLHNRWKRRPEPGDMIYQPERKTLG